MNDLLSTAQLCGYGLIFTLFLLLWTGCKGLMDLTTGKTNPQNSTVTCLLLCFSMTALVDVFLVFSGLIVGKGMSASEMLVGWTGIILGALLYIWSKKFVSKKDSEDAELTFPAWIICFASSGIGACSRTLFLQ